MPKVYITNHSGHDHTDAMRFGSLIFLTDGKLNRFDTNNMYRSMSEVIEASHRDDYILLTSLTSLCSVACSMFAYKHGCLNLLIWKGSRYVERRHSMGELLRSDLQERIDKMENRIERLKDKANRLSQEMPIQTRHDMGG